MRLRTLDLLRCPSLPCRATLEMGSYTSLTDGEDPDLLYGDLLCTQCKTSYPVLAGVAIVVNNAKSFLSSEGEAILKYIDPSMASREQLTFLEADKPCEGTKFAKGNLNSEVITSRYIAADYLSANGESWWVPEGAPPSRLLDETIKAHWESGPVPRLAGMLEAREFRAENILDLGCGVGGAVGRLSRFSRNSLGVDRSFVAVLKARQINSGEMTRVKVQTDLLHGAFGKSVAMPAPSETARRADFVVGDVLEPPVAFGVWDLVTAFGVLDIMVSPLCFPPLHVSLASTNGFVAQGSPYQWSLLAAKTIHEAVPPTHRSSSAAAEWLYEKAGVEILERDSDIPWIMYKDSRHLILYSVHLFLGRKQGKPLL